MVTNVYIFSVFFSVFFAFFIGILYIIPLNVGVKYFPEKKGLICGLILGFFGLSGIIV